MEEMKIDIRSLLNQATEQSARFTANSIAHDITKSIMSKEDYESNKDIYDGIIDELNNYVRKYERTV